MTEAMAYALWLYEKEGATVKELCKIAGVGRKNFYAALRRSDIPRRGRGSREHVNIHRDRKREWKGDDGEWTNLIHLQNAYGVAFVRLANRVLAGEVGFSI